MNREEYVERMRSSRQFRYFNLQPEWFPGTGDVEGFIHDEVVRQFHDTRVREDGGIRVKWMGQAWEYAQALADGSPTVQTILALGALVEQKVNAEGFRDYGVTIGGRNGAPYERIPDFVAALVDTLPVAPVQGRVGFHVNAASPQTFTEDVKRVRTADDWYLAYEWIHPFGDGNGRSGKVLHNWLLGTLDDPVLVADYFGGGNP